MGRKWYLNAPHSSTLAWKIPWMVEPGGLQSIGSLESDTTERLHFHFSLSCTGEGNGNPLQCSCLENPRDREVWWAAVYGVAQSRTRLKWLSSSSSRSDLAAAAEQHTGYHGKHPMYLLIAFSSVQFSRVWLFETPWTIACQAPLSMEFSRLEYWSE